MEAKIAGFYTPDNPKKVLVAPLDWGLGHATRCIPVIRQLVSLGHEVWLAGESPVQTLLQAEFPNLPWLPLQGYRVRYGRSSFGTIAQLVRQLPSMVRSIKAEHRWLQKQMREHRFDVVISDNRYGLHHPTVHCIFITHQLQVQTPTRLSTALLRRLHYRLIRHFDACWVPDFPEAPGLAGALAHPAVLPALAVRHTGPMSRLEKRQMDKRDYVLLLLSGPEPQRSLLEQVLLRQAAGINRSFVLVRGLPGAAADLVTPPHITIFSHLDAASLQDLMARAALVICRSGYSTVMDLAALAQKSILIPTPAQTEQQYLAGHLQQQGYAMWRSQHRFDLREALMASSGFAYRRWPQSSRNLLLQVIDNLFEQLPAGKACIEKEQQF